MTVYNMLELCTDASGIHISIFDCISEQVVFDSNKLDQYSNIVMEIYLSPYADYEVCSYDLYLHNGVVNLEFNIDYEPDDEE